MVMNQRDNSSDQEEEPWDQRGSVAIELVSTPSGGANVTTAAGPVETANEEEDIVMRKPTSTRGAVVTPPSSQRKSRAYDEDRNEDLEDGDLPSLQRQGRPSGDGGGVGGRLVNGQRTTARPLQPPSQAGLGIDDDSSSSYSSLDGRPTRRGPNDQRRKLTPDQKSKQRKFWSQLDQTGPRGEDDEDDDEERESAARGYGSRGDYYDDDGPEDERAARLRGDDYYSVSVPGEGDNSTAAGPHETIEDAAPDFCGSTLNALGDICGIGLTESLSQDKTRPDPPAWNKTSSAARRMETSQEEHTAIEVEFVEPSPPRNRAVRPESPDKPVDKKAAYLAAMATKAKADYDAKTGGNTTADVVVAPSVDSMTSGDDDDIYASFNAQEKRKFLKLINEGVVPTEASQRIADEREVAKLSRKERRQLQKLQKDQEQQKDKEEKSAVTRNFLRGKRLAFWKKNRTANQSASDSDNEAHNIGNETPSPAPRKNRGGDAVAATPPSVATSSLASTPSPTKRATPEQTPESYSSASTSSHLSPGMAAVPPAALAAMLALDKAASMDDEEQEQPAAAITRQAESKKSEVTVSQFAASGINYYDAVRRDMSSDEEDIRVISTVGSTEMARRYSSTFQGTPQQQRSLAPKPRGFTPLKEKSDRVPPQMLDSYGEDRSTSPSPTPPPPPPSTPPPPPPPSHGGSDPKMRSVSMKDGASFSAIPLVRDDAPIPAGQDAVMHDADVDAIERIEQELLRPASNVSSLMSSGQKFPNEDQNEGVSRAILAATAGAAVTGVAAATIAQSIQTSSGQSQVSYPLSEEEDTKVDMDEYLSSTDAYGSYAAANNANSDAQSVFTAGTGLYSVGTGISTYTQSSRKRRPGAAKNRLAKTKEANQSQKARGWHESIIAAAVTTNRDWKPSKGWVDYHDPRTEEMDVMSSDKKIHIDLSKAISKDGLRNNEASEGLHRADGAVPLPFPKDWEADRNEMISVDGEPEPPLQRPAEMDASKSAPRTQRQALSAAALDQEARAISDEESAPPVSTELQETANLAESQDVPTTAASSKVGAQTAAGSITRSDAEPESLAPLIGVAAAGAAVGATAAVMGSNDDNAEEEWHGTAQKDAALEPGATSSRFRLQGPPRDTERLSRKKGGASPTDATHQQRELDRVEQKIMALSTGDTHGDYREVDVDVAAANAAAILRSSPVDLDDLTPDEDGYEAANADIDAMILDPAQAPAPISLEGPPRVTKRTPKSTDANGMARSAPVDLDELDEEREQQESSRLLPIDQMLLDPTQAEPPIPLEGPPRVTERTSKRTVGASPQRMRNRSDNESRPRGWLESMKVASAPLAKEGRCWDPERGWAAPGETEHRVPDVVDFDYEDVSHLTAPSQLPGPQAAETHRDDIKLTSTDRGQPALVPKDSVSIKQGTVNPISPESQTRPVDSEKTYSIPIVSPDNANRNDFSEPIVYSQRPAQEQSDKQAEEPRDQERRRSRIIPLLPPPRDAGGKLTQWVRKSEKAPNQHDLSAADGSDRATASSGTLGETYVQLGDSDRGQKAALVPPVVSDTVDFGSDPGNGTKTQGNVSLDTSHAFPSEDERPANSVIDIVKEKIDDEDRSLFPPASKEKRADRRASSKSVSVSAIEHDEKGPRRTSPRGEEASNPQTVPSVFPSPGDTSPRGEGASNPQTVPSVFPSPGDTIPQQLSHTSDDPWREWDAGPVDLDASPEPSEADSGVGPVDLDNQASNDEDVWDDERDEHLRSFGLDSRSEASLSTAARSAKSVPKLRASARDTSPVRVRKPRTALLPEEYPGQEMVLSKDAKGASPAPQENEGAFPTPREGERVYIPSEGIYRTPSLEKNEDAHIASDAISKEDIRQPASLEQDEDAPVMRKTPTAELDRPSLPESPSVRNRRQQWESRATEPERSSAISTEKNAEWKSFLNKKVVAEGASASQMRKMSKRGGDGATPAVSSHNLGGIDRVMRSLDSEDEDDSLFEFGGRKSATALGRSKLSPIQRSLDDGTDYESSVVTTSDAYGPDPAERRSFLQRIAECAAPVMGKPGKDGIPANLAPNFCYRPDGTVGEDYGAEESFDSTANEEPQKKTSSKSTRRSKRAAEVHQTPSAGSTVSDDFGAKTAYLEAIAMKTAVSKPRKSDSRRRSGRAGSSVVSGASSQHSEKWKAFLDRKKSTGSNAGHPRASSSSDVSKAAERYAATKLDEIMANLPERSNSTSRNRQPEPSAGYERRALDDTMTPAPESLEAAEDLAAARVEAMMAALSNSNVDDEEEI